MPTNISTALTSGITLTSSATTITSTGSITDNGAYDNAVYGTLTGTQYIDNQGKILGSGTGIFLATPGMIVNENSISQTGGIFGFGIYLGQGGTVINNAGALISGYYGIELTGGTITNAGTITGSGPNHVAINFGFGTTDALLVVDQGSVINGVIGGAGPGITIDYANQIITSESFSNGTLSLLDNNVLLGTLALSGLNSYDSSDFHLKSDHAGGTDITIGIPCFTTGTNISTPTGLAEVQNLRTGDNVLTVDGNAVPVRWAGSKRVNLTNHPSPQTVLPVCIKAGALAENTPARDLYVSPDHAMYLHNVLVPAQLLVNGKTILQPARSGFVDYFHIELDPHQLIIAEGAVTESFLNTGNKTQFAEPGAVRHLSIEDPKTWEDACAPLVLAGPQLVNIQTALSIRANELGCGTLAFTKAA
jgi:hypothetical protein